jgi:hypothetical protein
VTVAGYATGDRRQLKGTEDAGDPPARRIAGIRIGVNWSALGIFALITYGLAAV